MTKKILLIASYASSLTSFRYYLIKALLNEGYQVFACAPQDGDPANDDVAARLAQINVKFISISLKRTGINPFSDLHFLRKLVELIRTLQVSTVLSYTIKPVIYGSLAAKIAGTKQIYSMITGLGYVYSTQSIKSTLLRLLTTPLLKLAIHFNHRVFFQNKDNLNEFRQRGIIKKADQTVIINGSGINIDEFVPSAYPDKVVFLLVARMLINKGVRDYVAAAAIIKQQFPDIKFLIVGWEDKNPNAITKNEIQSWIDSSVIEYCGRLADVRPVIAQSSVFVLPSYAEGTPRSVLEAMAMSRPIITTDVPGCRETVIEGENGFLVPRQDKFALAAAMRRFIDEPHLVSNMGFKSRQIAVDKYDVHKVNQKIINTMEGEIN